MTDVNDSAPIEARKEWDEVADEVVAAILERLKPVLKKASESIYDDLLYTAQDYLIDNVRWNIRSTIDAANRQAYADRLKAKEQGETITELLMTLQKVRRELLIPAAEYVPAIPAVWEIIDTAVEKVLAK